MFLVESNQLSVNRLNCGVADKFEAKLIRFLWSEIARWEDAETQPYKAKQLRSENTQDQDSHADMSPSDRRAQGLFSILSDDDDNALNVATLNKPGIYQRLTIGRGEILLVNGKLLHAAASVQGIPKTRIWIGMGSQSKFRTTTNSLFECPG